MHATIIKATLNLSIENTKLCIKNYIFGQIQTILVELLNNSSSSDCNYYIYLCYIDFFVCKHSLVQKNTLTSAFFFVKVVSI